MSEGTARPAGDGLDSFELVQRWSKLSPEHLKAAMTAFDAQLARSHELNMLREQNDDAKARREHRLFVISTVFGFVLIITLTSGAVLLAMRGQIALPTIFTTLSVSMATVFVLRKHDPKQMRAVVQAQAKIAHAFSALPANVSNGGAPIVDAAQPVLGIENEGDR